MEPSLLTPDLSVRQHNVDNSTGTLRSAALLGAPSLNGNEHWVYSINSEKNKFESDNRPEFLLNSRVRYVADGVLPKKSLIANSENIDWYKLGITPPEANICVDSEGKPVTDNNGNISKGFCIKTTNNNYGVIEYSSIVSNSSTNLNYTSCNFESGDNFGWSCSNHSEQVDFNTILKGQSVTNRDYFNFHTQTSIKNNVKGCNDEINESSNITVLIVKYTDTNGVPTVVETSEIQNISFTKLIRKSGRATCPADYPDNGSYAYVRQNLIADITVTNSFYYKVYIKSNNEYILVSTVNNSTTITISTNSDTKIGAIPAITFPSDTLTSFDFTMTYYDSINNVESAPMDLFTQGIFGIFIFDVVDIPISNNPLVDRKRIYISDKTTGKWVLLREIDNSDTETNNISINGLEYDELLNSVGNYPPNGELINITQAYGIMFGSVDNNLYFSKTGQYDYWPPENSITFQDTITGILPISGVVLVFTENSTLVLSGNDKSNFAVGILSLEQGCISRFSLQYFQSRPLWLSRQGLCTITNNSVTVISKDIIGAIKFDIVQSVMSNEQYFLLVKDGTIHCFDFRYNAVSYRTYKYDLDIKQMYEYNSELYFTSVNTDNVLEEYKFGDMSNGLISMSYLSPIITESSFTVVKQFAKLFITYKGTFTVKVTKYQISGTSEQTFDIDSSNDIVVNEENLSSESRRFYGIQVEITGIGEIYEVRI